MDRVNVTLTKLDVPISLPTATAQTPRQPAKSQPVQPSPVSAPTSQVPATKFHEATPVIAEDSVQGVQRIQDVKKIYVDSLGDDLIRSKIITELVKSNQFEVVVTPEKADAVLMGAGT